MGSQGFKEEMTACMEDASTILDSFFLLCYMIYLFLAYGSNSYGADAVLSSFHAQ